MSGLVVKQISFFAGDEHAVLGLPLRLTVSIIIGIVALTAILSYFSNPCLFPGKIMVSVTPMIGVISDSNPTSVTFCIFTNDTKGHPLSGATVIITGLGGAGFNSTDYFGKTIVQIEVVLESGSLEGYLDVSVKAACCDSFFQKDYLKIVKTSV